jgi:hypothetical protein
VDQRRHAWQRGALVEAERGVPLRHQPLLTCFECVSFGVPAGNFSVLKKIAWIM